MDTKILFDLARLGSIKDISEIASVMVNHGQNGIGVHMGTPGLVRRKDFESSKSKSTVLFTYPPSPGLNPNYATITGKHDLTLLDECFLHSHRNMIVPGFDSSKIRKINDYVNKQSALSLTIERVSRITGTIGQATSRVMLDLTNKLEGIATSYKYHTLQYIHINDGYTAMDTDDIGYTITFMSLHDCISIFNPKRVDGMYMLINMYEKSRSQIGGILSGIVRLGVALSNYEDNIFVVDGVRINGAQLLTYKTIDRLRKVIEINTQIKTKNKKKKSNSISASYFSNTGASINLSGTSNTQTYYYSTDSSSTFTTA